MNTPNPSAPESGTAVSTAEHLSALCDGAIGPTDLDALMAECRADTQTLERWHAYHLIGATLRGNEPAMSRRGSVDFLDGIRSRLQAETPDLPVVADEPVPVKAALRPAANDGVFRWKLVAGFASVAAVAAVGWNLMATVPGASAPGGQLAQSPVTQPLAVATTAPAASASPALPSPGQTVAVGTRQGTVIRDAGLERLLAEHRQHGGMSALQNPTGFIRNATYDTDAR